MPCRRPKMAPHHSGVLVNPSHSPARPSSAMSHHKTPPTPGLLHLPGSTKLQSSTAQRRTTRHRQPSQQQRAKPLREPTAIVEQVSPSPEKRTRTRHRNRTKNQPHPSADSETPAEDTAASAEEQPENTTSEQAGPEVTQKGRRGGRQKPSRPPPPSPAATSAPPASELSLGVHVLPLPFDDSTEPTLLSDIPSPCKPPRSTNKSKSGRKVHPKKIKAKEQEEHRIRSRSAEPLPVAAPPASTTPTPAPAHFSASHPITIPAARTSGGALTPLRSNILPSSAPSPHSTRPRHARAQSTSTVLTATPAGGRWDMPVFSWSKSSDALTWQQQEALHSAPSDEMGVKRNKSLRNRDPVVALLGTDTPTSTPISCRRGGRIVSASAGLSGDLTDGRKPVPVSSSLPDSFASATTAGRRAAAPTAITRANTLASVADGGLTWQQSLFRSSASNSGGGTPGRAALYDMFGPLESQPLGASRSMPNSPPKRGIGGRQAQSDKRHAEVLEAKLGALTMGQSNAFLGSSNPFSTPQSGLSSSPSKAATFQPSPLRISQPISVGGPAPRRRANTSSGRDSEKDAAYAGPRFHNSPLPSELKPPKFRLKATATAPALTTVPAAATVGSL